MRNHVQEEQIPFPARLFLDHWPSNHSRLLLIPAFPPGIRIDSPAGPQEVAGLMKTLLLLLVIIAPLLIIAQNDAPPGVAPPPAPAVPGRYVILYSSDAAGLEAKVSRAIIEGWEPAGGVATSAGAGGPVSFYQAVVKRVGRVVGFPGR